MKKVTSLILLLAAIYGNLSANPHVSVRYEMTDGYMPLVGTRLVIDRKDDNLVGKVASMFSNDFSMVTGDSIPVSYKFGTEKNVIIFGTDKSSHIKKLAKNGIIDIKPIENGVEQYIIKKVSSPMKGVDNALVVVGCDRRGAAYGLLSVSEQLGVSPWWWWADVPVPSHKAVYIDADYVSERPSVRYRGIFINDEDWGLYPWAAKNYEKEVGNIGPRTYRRVCELLLRLKCNMLAPAMHTCSDTFYSHDENKKVADEYGILITTSHCEPLLVNNASKFEWDFERDGDWNYVTNRKAIYDKLDARVKEASGFENIYTMGLRGHHDEGMRGNLTLDERVEVIQQAIKDQREIVSKHIDAPIDSIPQILVPYKEVQKIYENGLKVPEHITLVWPDDNYGYMKMLSNDNEQKRAGRSGVYYHISYLGVPHDHLWISTTAPMLMYEEMKKAYDTGADRYWLLNVGDIKPMELSMQLFFSMAWDFKRFNYDNVNEFQADFLSKLFGEKYRADFQWMLDDYYRLAWSRKPEAMGWERAWDAPEFTGLKDTEYSFQNYNDAKSRLADYAAISDMASSILDKLPENEKPAFYEMIAYPVMASSQMNRKFLLAQLNHELVAKGELDKANWAGEQSRLAFDSIASLTDRYNNMLGGKWKHMMSVPKGMCSLYQNMPEIVMSADKGSTPVDLAPVVADYRLDSCLYVPVYSFDGMKIDGEHSLRLLNGIGYDWVALQMGEVTQPSVNASDLEGFRVDYGLPRIDSDSIKVIIYTVPRFPLYKGAGTSFGVSVDGAAPIVEEYIPVEQSRQWKDNVIRNSMISEVMFPIDKNADSHRISITCGAPGLIIQRILVDWGGLKPTYVGPSNPKRHVRI